MFEFSVFDCHSTLTMKSRIKNKLPLVSTGFSNCDIYPYHLTYLNPEKLLDVTSKITLFDRPYLVR